MSLSGGGRGVHTPIAPVDRRDIKPSGDVETSVWTPEQINEYLSEKYGRRALDKPEGKPPVMMDFDVEQAKKRMPRRVNA